MTASTGGSSAATFQVRNTTNTAQTVTLISSCTNFVSCPTTTSSPQSIPPFLTVGQSVSFTASSATGIGYVRLEAWQDGSLLSSATVTVTVQPPAGALSLVPHAGERIDVGNCVANCFEATLSYALPAYQSLGASRSVSLLYRSGRARPFGKVEIDATNNSAPAGARILLQLVRSDGTYVTWTNGTTSLYFTAAAGGTTRLAGEFDASTFATGRYSYTAQVTYYDAAGTALSATGSVALGVIVVNDQSGPYGAGVEVVGVQRAYVQSDGVLVTDGTGTASFFASNCTTNPCTYTAPGGDFSTFSAQGGGYARSYTDGTRVTFDANGYETSVADRFGNTTTYTYVWNATSSVWALSYVTDPAGTGTRLDYRPAGDPNWKAGTLSGITQVMGPGRSATFGVDWNNDLRDVIDGDGASFGHALYDGTHRLTHWQDRNGGAWDYTYANASTSRVASIVAPTVTVSGASARPTTQLREPSGALFQAAAAAGGTSVTNPVPAGDVRARVTDPRSNATYFTTNRFGAPMKVEYPTGGVETTTYDANSGLPIQTVSVSADTIDYTWTGPLLTGTYDRATTVQTNMSYALSSCMSQLAGVSHSIGGGAAITDQTLTYNTSQAGCPLATSKVGAQAASSFSVGADGRVLSVTDPAGNVTRNYYATTGLRNLDSTSYVGLPSTLFHYDAFGRVTWTRHPSLGTDSTEYDLLNRTVATVDGIGRRTVYHWGSLYLDNVTDAKGQSFTYSRNAMGWVERETRPGSALALQYAYDAGGNVMTLTNRRNGPVQVTYDALGRVSSRAADGKTASYTYSADGRIVTAANENAADTTWLDVVGRAVQENSARRSGWYGTTRAFNADGTLRSWTAASNGKWTGTESADYTYDPYGVLQTFTTWGANPNTLAYNNAGQLTSLTYPNGMYRGESPTPQYASMQSYFSYASVDSALGQTVGLDSVGRVSQAKVSGTDRLRVFDYNAAGSLQGMHFLSGAQRTACVAAPTPYGPVFGAQCPYSYSQQYRADAFYRDGADNVSPNSATAFSYTGNRLTSANGTTYTYDDDGNLIHRVRTGLDQTLYWDTLGQLYSVVTNGTTTNFGYDAQGRRVWKVNPATGDTIRYLYQGDKLYMQLDNNGVPTINYRYAPGEDVPHEIATAGGYFYVARDKVSGSVAGLIREGALGAAAIVAKYGYDAFGNLLPDESFDQIGNNVRHAGRLFDPETGLYYNRARYYDPEVGRFISEDLVGLNGGLNQYVYAGNDPVNSADQTGLDPECIPTPNVPCLPNIPVTEPATPPKPVPWWITGWMDLFNFVHYDLLPPTGGPVVVGTPEKPAPPQYSGHAPTTTTKQCVENAVGSVAALGTTLLASAVATTGGRMLTDAGRQALEQSRIITNILISPEGGPKQKIEEAIALQTGGWLALRWGTLLARGGVIVGGFAGGYAIGAYAMCAQNPNYYSR